MSEILVQLLGYFFAGGMAYGAIRVDLKNIHERLGDLKDVAKDAHRRLDDHLADFHNRGTP